MEGPGFKPQEDSDVLVRERASKKNRVTEVKPAQRRTRAPRRGTSLLVATSLMLGGAAAYFNRGGSSNESRQAPTGQEVGRSLNAGSVPQEASSAPIQEKERQPIVLEARDVVGDRSAPFAISYESMGLAGKMDAATNTLVDVPTEEIISDETNKEAVLLAKIRRTLDGKIMMTDISPTGMDTKAVALIQQTFAPVLPVFEASFEIGGLFDVTIGTQKSPGTTFRNHSQYDPGKKSMFIDINMNQGYLDIEDTRATAWHEAAHSVFAKKSISHSIKEFKPHPEEVEKYSSSCKAVRDYAIDEFEIQAEGFISEMEKIGEKIPKFKLAADQLIQSVREKNLNGFFPQQESGNGEFMGVNTCNFIGGTGLLMDASKAFGVSFDPEQATEEEKDALQGVDALMKKFVHKESIYRAITDATYVMDPMAGHPYDNLDEAAASMFAITLIAPEELGNVINSLPPEGKDVIVNFYTGVMEIFTDTSSNLKNILQPGIDIVHQQLMQTKDKALA